MPFYRVYQMEGSKADIGAFFSFKKLNVPSHTCDIQLNESTLQDGQHG